MSKPVLAVLGNFTEEVEARIARDFAVRRVSTDAPAGAAANPAEELLRAAEGADAIFFNPPAKLDAEFFAAGGEVGEGDCDIFGGVRSH